MPRRTVRTRALVGVGREELYQLFAQRGYTKGCEVGVREGRNAALMLKTIPHLELILVDPYLAYEFKKFQRRNRWKWHQETMDRVRRSALNRLGRSNVRWLMTFSEQAALSVPDQSLDFVYIDGNHDFQHVMQDILCWKDKIKSEGVLCGHDYGIRSVHHAVKSFARYHGYHIAVTDRSKERNRSGTVISWMIEHEKTA